MMKRNLICFVLFLIPLFAFSQNRSLERDWRSDREKVRIISYNIFNGLVTDADRRERFCEWVRKQDPEVLALEELCGHTEEDLSRMAKSWGHNYAVMLKQDGYPVGLTSKRPITVIKKQLDGFAHGMLHAKTFGIDFIVTHLSPSSLEMRKAESDFISNYIQKNSFEYCVLLGDMNDVSPFDADFKNSSDWVDYSVISRFLSVGMYDVCRYFVAAEDRSTFPTPILVNVSKHSRIRERRSDRLDFIFANKNLCDKVTDAFIWKDEETDYLSDHYPVGIDFFVER